MTSSGMPDISTYTDFNSLHNMKYAANINDEKTLRKVAHQFEAIFLQTLLSNMRKSEIGDDIFSSDQTKLYQDLFDKQISSTLSEKGSLGLADLLVKQLIQEGGVTQPGNDIRSNPMIQQDNTITNRINQVSEKSLQPHVFSNPDEFIAHLTPIAKEVADLNGFSEKIFIAQSALETGWGRYTIQNERGISSYNLFGIKSNNGWDGDTIASSTVEYINGVASRSVERFRAYDNYEHSLEDYVEFIKNQPRYEQAYKNRQTPEAYFIALHEAGYATDPNYVSKISKILTGLEQSINTVTVKN